MSVKNGRKFFLLLERAKEKGDVTEPRYYIGVNFSTSKNVEKSGTKEKLKKKERLVLRNQCVWRSYTASRRLFDDVYDTPSVELLSSRHPNSLRLHYLKTLHRKSDVGRESEENNFKKR